MTAAATTRAERWISARFTSTSWPSRFNRLPATKTSVMVLRLAYRYRTPGPNGKAWSGSRRRADRSCCTCRSSQYRTSTRGHRPCLARPPGRRTPQIPVTLSGIVPPRRSGWSQVTSDSQRQYPGAIGDRASPPHLGEPKVRALFGYRCWPGGSAWEPAGMPRRRPGTRR
jgi:hypothetical protein